MTERAASDLTARRIALDVADRPARLHVDETLDEGLRRIAAHYLDAAIGGITDRGGDPDIGIHTARKSLKRVRAMLRLVRDEIGHRNYRDGNVVLRDVGRGLADARDGAVMVATLDSVTGRFRDVIAPGAFSAFRARLVEEGDLRRARLLGDTQQLADLATTLRVARNRFVAPPGDGIGIRDEFAAISGGLGRTYRRGRLGLGRAYAERSGEAFHEWRKRVKYLRHQMEALERLWPDVVGGAAAGLDHLGEILGSEHDLTMLLETARIPGFGVSGDRQTVLESAVYAARGDLRLSALPIGRRVYTEPGSAFARRIGGYWPA